MRLWHVLACSKEKHSWLLNWFTVWVGVGVQRWSSGPSSHEAILCKQR